MATSYPKATENLRVFGGRLLGKNTMMYTEAVMQAMYKGQRTLIASYLHNSVIVEPYLHIPKGLQQRSYTAHLYRGNQARKINLKTKHDTNIYSVHTRRR